MPAGDAGHERQACEVCREIDRLQAQLAAQQVVVDAARDGLEYIANLTWTLPEAYAAANQMQERAFYDLSRMDKAQAAQPEGDQAR